MMQLKKRTFLITGAGHRLGFHFAKALLRQGATVIAHYNTDCQELQAWLHKEVKYSEQVIFCQANLRTELSKIEQIFKDQSETLSGVVNSAALFEQGDISDTVAFEYQLELNTLVPTRLAALFSRYCHEGAVLNIIDGNIRTLNKNFQSYRISKLFLEELTRQMAFLYAPKLRVNALSPGTVIPPKGGEDTSFELARKRAPLKRTPSLESIVETALFLLQNESITGEIVAVDGGVHIL